MHVATHACFPLTFVQIFRRHGDESLGLRGARLVLRVVLQPPAGLHLSFCRGEYVHAAFQCAYTHRLCDNSLLEHYNKLSTFVLTRQLVLSLLRRKRPTVKLLATAATMKLRVGHIW